MQRRRRAVGEDMSVTSALACSLIGCCHERQVRSLFSGDVRTDVFAG